MQIYDGTLCTRGPWEALVAFQQLLVLADQEGNVDMTAAAISRRTTIPLEIIEKGIAALLLPDPESRTPTEEGRRIVPLCEGRSWGWRVVNYKHYRDLKREEDRRAYHREYWNKKRSTNKTQQTQQNSTDSTYTEAEANAEAVKTKRPRKRVTPLPPDFTISEAVKAWAAERGFTRLPERLEHFKNWATAKASTYADWDAAFRNAISGDWAKLNGNGHAAADTEPAWQSFRNCIRAGNCPEDPILRAITIKFGGSNRLGEMTSRDIDFKRKEFDQMYQELSNRP